MSEPVTQASLSALLGEAMSEKRGHWQVDDSNCSCGWFTPFKGIPELLRADVRRHIIDAALPVLHAHFAAALETAGRDALVAAWDEGYDMGDPYQRRGNPGEGKHCNPYRAEAGAAERDGVS